MIDYNKKLETMAMHCDGCCYAEEFKGTFEECIQEAKFVGWSIEPDGSSKYYHYCEDCISGDVDYEV